MLISQIRWGRGKSRREMVVSKMEDEYIVTIFHVNSDGTTDHQQVYKSGDKESVLKWLEEQKIKLFFGLVEGPYMEDDY